MSNLNKYAELVVKVAINLQKDQTLVINSPITSVEFVRAITKKAYEVGARYVHVEWNDEEITKLKLLKAPEEALKEFPIWKAKGFEEMAEAGAAFLSISASNPDLLREVDPQRVAINNKTAAEALQNFRRYTQTGKVSWAIVSVPTKEWADKVFANLDESERVNALWENIFKVTRVNLDDPVASWKEHINNLRGKLEYLNNKKFKKLYFKNHSTDLVVELPNDHLWIGGGLKNEKGNEFIPNMPTEEVFTMPLKTGVNGYITSTKPLNYGGQVIENFTMTFKEGRIVDFTAEKGYETLKKLIETDEGSHYLGEVALVPHKSPVSDSNIVFFNTLFDENASSHLALGSAYPLCIEDGGRLSKVELEERGANTSLVHVDFMIGSNDMNVDGETLDGKLYPIFRGGNWSI